MKSLKLSYSKVSTVHKTFQELLFYAMYRVLPPKNLVQRFGTVLDVQFFMDVMNMLAHSAGTHGKFVGNLFVQ
jgi:hypothetical protein